MCKICTYSSFDLARADLRYGRAARCCQDCGAIGMTTNGAAIGFSGTTGAGTFKLYRPNYISLTEYDLSRVVRL
ncbi:MAG: hypothetical protein JWL62_3830 [Hyphomicrobiales bacterium]|nr:hypothetical protein [Hyphomicrobiales bacterium]